jgi:hypothetical protein
LQEIKSNANYKTRVVKNRKGFYKKGSHPSNNLKLKSILSILTMGIFIFFGFASIDEGDPETKSVNCEFLPSAVIVTQKCTFHAFDQVGVPPINLIITFHIREYEKVDDNGLCTLLYKNEYTREGIFSTDGTASFILAKRYVSNDDVIEINFKLSKFQYVYYPYSYSLSLHKYDPELNSDIHLLKINSNP